MFQLLLPTIAMDAQLGIDGRTTDVHIMIAIILYRPLVIAFVASELRWIMLHMNRCPIVLYFVLSKCQHKFIGGSDNENTLKYSTLIRNRIVSYIVMCQMELLFI